MLTTLWAPKWISGLFWKMTIRRLSGWITKNLEEMLFCKILYINKTFLVVFVDHSAALPRSRRCLKCAPSRDLEEAGQRGGEDYAMGKSLGKDWVKPGPGAEQFPGLFYSFVCSCSLWPQALGCLLPVSVKGRNASPGPLLCFSPPGGQRLPKLCAIKHRSFALGVVKRTKLL